MSKSASASYFVIGLLAVAAIAYWIDGKASSTTSRQPSTSQQPEYNVSISIRP